MPTSGRRSTGTSSPRRIPAEWTRLKQQRDDEATLLAEANRRGQADIAIADERAEQALLRGQAGRARQAREEAAGVFRPGSARQTYDDSSNFLFAKGIPADRINAIHEAPIIELALAAMRFEQAQKQASTVTARARRGEHHREDDTDPHRSRTGQSRRQPERRGGSASGRAVQESGGASIADAAELIRLSDL